MKDKDRRPTLALIIKKIEDRKSKSRKERHEKDPSHSRQVRQGRR
jgi:hypothetical protein